MKTPFNKLIASFVLSLFVISGVNVGTADARGGSSSSSRSSSFSSSYSRPSTSSYSRPSTPSVSTNYTKPSTTTQTYTKPAVTTAPAVNQTYTKPAVTTAPVKPATPAQAVNQTYTKPAVATAPAAMSKTDQALADKAKMSGTQFTSREAAQADFQKKYATQYANKFDREPTKRPDHIPSTINDGGRNVNVVFDRQHGGYGYYGPSGAWIMYDAMRDAAMLSVLMNQHHYAVTKPVVYNQPAVVVQQGHGFGYYLLWTLFWGALVVSAIMGIRKLRSIPGKSSNLKP